MFYISLRYADPWIRIPARRLWKYEITYGNKGYTKLVPRKRCSSLKKLTSMGLQGGRG